ncbi:MAG: plasmid pRiA4b ORF-3 family protein [Rhodomicrobium sp.]
MTSAHDIVRIKISLDNVKPTVMRRIEVPVSVKLDTLHEMIQAIMPWDNYHSYEFRVRESRWGIPMPEYGYFGFPVADARKATLAQALSEPNLKALRYTYDFGDDWRHTIKIERRFSAELWEEFPRLIAAKGRCPPEDIGGPWGYAECLEAISDPHHPRHTELVGWLGRRDPNEIDIAAIEVALSRFVKRLRARTRRTAKKTA